MFEKIKTFFSDYPDKSLDKLKSKYPTCNFREGSIITNSSFGEYVTILANSKIINSEIQNHSYIGANSCINNVSIGRYCSFGPDIKAGLGPHPTKDFVSTYPAFYSPDNDGCAKQFHTNRIFDDSIPKTHIGHDVWLGANVIIPGGVRIQTGSVIAAGSVVVKDVEPYSVIGGNPAKLIRYRFSENVIEKLIQSKWWEWPQSMIKENIDRFSNIDEFLEYIDSIT